VLFGSVLGCWFVFARDLSGLRTEIALGAGLGFGLAAFALAPVALASSLLDLDWCFGPGSTLFRPSSHTLFAEGIGSGGLNPVFSWSVIATFALALTAWFLLDGGRRRSGGVRWAMIVAVVCLFGTTGPAGPVWDATPVLSNLQFPWRLTAVLTLVAAALVGRLGSGRAWIVAGLTVASAVPFASWDRTALQTAFLTEEPTQPDAPGTVFPDPHTSWEAGSGGWYWRHHQLAELCLLPRTMPRRMLDELAGAHLPEYDDIRGRPAVLVEDPKAPVRVLRWSQTRRVLEVSSELGGTLVWRVLWFPEMRVTIDGEEQLADVDETTGLVIHPLPPGTHRVEIRWRAFRALGIARLVSLLSLAVVVVLIGVGLRRRRAQIDGGSADRIDDPS
jgi:hypothetical protein